MNLIDFVETVLMNLWLMTFRKYKRHTWYTESNHGCYSYQLDCVYFDLSYFPSFLIQLTCFVLGGLTCIGNVLE